MPKINCGKCTAKMPKIQKRSKIRKLSCKIGNVTAGTDTEKWFYRKIFRRNRENFRLVTVRNYMPTVVQTTDDKI